MTVPRELRAAPVTGGASAREVRSGPAIDAIVHSGFPSRPHGRKISRRTTTPKDAYAATEPP